jgi:peptide/nickel transport system substrate-binding protein
MIFRWWSSSYSNLIISKSYFEKVGPDVFARQPMGTGPYRFVHQVKDDEVVLEAFTNYWGGAPQIKRLVF